MAKIERLRSDRLAARPFAAHSSVGESGFKPLLNRQQILNGVDLNAEDGPLQKLFQQTEEDAAQLRNRFSWQALAKYRRSLAAFLKQVIEDGLAVDFHTSRINLPTRSRKRYTILRLVEKQNLELASIATRRQVDEIALLAKINRIRGLLIDLLS